MLKVVGDVSYFLVGFVLNVVLIFEELVNYCHSIEELRQIPNGYGCLQTLFYAYRDNRLCLQLQ